MTSLPSTHVADGTDSVRRLQSFAHLMFCVWERWCAINLDAMRGAYVAVSMNSRSMADDMLRAQLTSYEEGVERAADYVRSVNALCLSTHAAVAQLNADTMIESTGSMPAFLEQVGTSAPHAARDVFAIMESAMNNGNAIYERLLETGREMADTNLAVAARAFQPMLPAPRRLGKSTTRAA